MATRPIGLLVGEIVGAPSDDGAIWTSLSIFDVGVDTMDLFENSVQRSTIFQVDLPMVTGIEDGGMPSTDCFFVCGVVAESLIAHKGLSLLALLSGVGTSGIAEDNVFGSKFEPGRGWW